MSDAETQGFLTIWALGSGGVVFAASMYLLRYWARPGQNKFAQVTIVFSWFLAFAVCFILPVDFVPSSDKTALDVVWRFIWWLSFLLCWIIIPLVSDYTTAGEFTFGGRLKYAIRMNLIIYGVGAVLFVAGLIAIAVQHNLNNDQIGYLITCIANIFGLGLVVLLLGFGVVELPRSLWRSGADRRVRLQLLLCGLQEQATDYDEAKKQLYQVRRFIQQIGEQVADMERNMLSEVIRNCPRDDEFDVSDILHERLEPIGRLEDIRPTNDMSPEQWRATLEKLNLFAIETRRRIQLAHGLFKASCDEALSLEKQIRESRTLPQNSAVGRLNRFCWSLRHDTVPTLHRVAAVVCAVMSAMVVLSEAMLPAPVGWTPIGALLRALRTRAPWLVPLVGDIWLGYQMACCCFSMFKIRFPGFYQMAKKNSDAYSMLFNALNVGRFWAPMAYNFTALMKLDDTSGFQDVMGPMSNIPLLGSSLDLILPLFVPFLALIVVLNLHVRIARCFSCCFGPMLFEGSALNLNLDEGKSTLRREKRRRKLSSPDDVLEQDV